MRGEALLLQATRFAGVVFLMLALGLTSGGCAGRDLSAAPSPDELLKRGQEYLERQKYRQAQEVFQEFLDRYPSDKEAGDAELGLAKSFLGVREWDTAREELRVLMNRYAGTPLAEEARFLMGWAYAQQSLPPELDQELTQRGLEEFEAYLADYPDGPHRAEAQTEIAALREKLAKKRYRNGLLYLRMGFPEAARIYFETLLEDFGDTSIAPRVRFQLAEALSAMGDTQQALAIYRELRLNSTDRKLKEDCERRLRELGFAPGELSSG